MRYGYYVTVFEQKKVAGRG